ncbi:MAG: hypothetical protein H7Y31_09320 [Chitinophagaceae bacterium]|nr:hypothetical protein [Chitinophagaceae bacterium]
MTIQIAPSQSVDEFQRQFTLAFHSLAIEVYTETSGIYSFIALQKATPTHRLAELAVLRKGQLLVNPKMDFKNLEKALMEEFGLHVKFMRTDAMHPTPLGDEQLSLFLRRPVTTPLRNTNGSRPK